MEASYHVAITEEAVGAYFDELGLRMIIRANLSQDSLRNLFDPAIHFDDSELAAGENYVAQQRKLAVSAMSAGRRRDALSAFGRLLHGRQDFYAHTNWVALWLARNGGLGKNSPSEIEICRKSLNEPALVSGKASVFWYLACCLPLLGPWLERQVVPKDSHEVMNLDHPGRGPLFPFAVAAASKHSRQELGLLLADLGAEAGQKSVRQFLNR